MKIGKPMTLHRTTQSLLTVLLTVTMLTSFIRLEASGRHKKEKVQAATTEQTLPLSEADQQRFQYFFLEAVRQQEAGRYTAAYHLLEHCLDINPLSATAHYLMSLYQAQLHNDEKTLQHLETAAALQPSNSTYEEKLAQFYIATTNYDKAAQTFENIVANNKDRTDILNILLRLYQAKQNYKQMLSTIDRVEQVEGESEQTTLARMRVYELMGDKKNAQRTLTQMAKAHPYDVIYQVMLGNWLMQNKQQREAGRIFMKALQDEPNNAYALSSLHDYYRAIKQDSLANNIAERILMGKDVPTETRLTFLQQAIKRQQRNQEDSTAIIRLFDRMMQATPNDSTIALARMEYYIRSKMPQAEINKTVEEVLRLCPDNGDARMFLVYNLWKEQDWSRIDSISTVGILYNPDQVQFRYFQGLARYYLKDEAGALQSLKQAANQLSHFSNKEMASDIYSIMAEIYFHNGNSEQAFAAYDSCIAIKPDNMMALNNYAYYLSTTGGDLKKAEQMSARTIKAEPKNATFLDTYAWILYQQQRFAEARIYIDQTLACDSDSTHSADLLEHAGDIYAKIGEKEQAIQFYKQALQAGGDAQTIEQKIALCRDKKQERKQK